MNLHSELLYRRDGDGNLISITDTATQTTTHVASTNDVLVSPVFLIIVALAVLLFVYLAYRLFKPVPLT